MKPQDFSIDFRSGVPVYIQLVEQVRDHLAEGNLKPGDQLPTVRQMAAELRVNFNTIARAYRMLDEAGLISTQQGRGTFILEPLEENSSQYLLHNTLDIQVRRFLHQLERQGFSPDQVLVNLTENITAWSNGDLAKINSSDLDE